MNKKQLPDTSDAEEWLDADTFIYKGKVYKLEPDGKIFEIVKKGDGND